IGLGHRERVHHAPPFLDRRGVVLEQVEVVEKRIEASLEDERRQPVGQRVEALRPVDEAEALVDQVREQRQRGAREPEALGLRRYWRAPRSASSTRTAAAAARRTLREASARAICASFRPRPRTPRRSSATTAASRTAASSSSSAARIAADASG